MDRTTGLTLSEDVPFGEADGAPLLLDLLAPSPRPRGRLPAVVWIHGGGWESGDKRGGFSEACGPMLAQAGYAVLSVNYRLSDAALFPAQLHDVKAAVRWVRANADELAVDPDRIGVWGHSAGGHLAALVGTTGDRPELEGASGSAGVSSRVQAVIALSPPTDFLEIPDDWPFVEPRRATEKLVGGPLEERAELVRMANPIAHIRPDAPPFLIVHGAADGVVPVEQGLALHDALAAAGVDTRIEVLPDADHWFASASRGVTTADELLRIGQEAIAFFDRYLQE
ncbi:MAG TPA: alpha/beta hydrolase [Thermomicrobiales bacterium]|nr:alpha/beta hydrolase [Thermomicrobiales bacterium]